MNKYIMITTTFDNREEALNVVNLLLENRLVSCCQFFNITSSYWWNGKIENADEVLVKMKTKKELYKKIEKVILENHSYEVPEIVCYDITLGHKKYLDWIEEEVK